MECYQLFHDGTACRHKSGTGDTCPGCGVKAADRVKVEEIKCPFLRGKEVCGEEISCEEYKDGDHCEECGAEIPKELWKQSPTRPVRKAEVSWTCYQIKPSGEVCGRVNKQKKKGEEFVFPKFCKCGTPREGRVRVERLNCPFTKEDGNICGQELSSKDENKHLHRM